MPDLPDLTSPFDVSVQVVECTNCGAPVTQLPAGGQVKCQYCDALLMVTPRPAPEGPVPEEPASDEPVPAGPALARPAPGATFDYEPNPEHDDRVRAALAAGNVTARIDLAVCTPTDLAPLGKPASFPAWEKQMIPALRSHWQQAVPALRAAPQDPDAAQRVYWLASKLSLGYGYVASMHGGQKQQDLNLRGRAVLETALALLEGTDLGYALRCRLARAASRLGDPAAARGWLAPCDPYPGSVELDGELRLAVASIYRQEESWERILAVLGTEAAPVPVYGVRPAAEADGLRLHAYERLGDAGAWSRTLRQVLRRHSWPLMRGVLSTYRLAPRANARILRWILLRVGLIAGAVVGLVVALALVTC